MSKIIIKPIGNFIETNFNYLNSFPKIVLSDKAIKALELLRKKYLGVKL